MEHSVPEQRRLAFNPEAASFSPVTTPADLADLEVPRPHNDSPFRPNRQLLGTHRVHDNQVLMSKEDLRHSGVSLEALDRSIAGNKPFTSFNASPMTITENSSGLVHGLTTTTSVEPIGNVPRRLTAKFPVSNMDYIMMSPQSAAPIYNDVDIDELSASLGLPSATKETTSSTDATQTHKSRASQDQTALFGNLINRALNKPLTADSLARYLRNPNEPLEHAVKASQQSQNLVEYGISTEQQVPVMKAVHPPPGFGDQMSRMVAVDNDYAPTDPAFDGQEISLAAPSTYFPLYPISPQHVAQYQHHGGPPSSKKRPRAYTRTKRTDQGPEPSPADIYPEDAHFTPSRLHRRTHFAPPPRMHLTPQNVVRMEDVESWPTPAEVYTHQTQAQAPTITHPPQLLGAIEPHVPPTTEDLSAADAEVLSLLSELPGPTVTTLLNFGSVDLVGEERQLSPAQESGARYGVNGYGIGVGDKWQPPLARESDPFRVRPRYHEGWGGHDWAMENGLTGACQPPY